MALLDVPTAVLCAMVTRAVLALALVFYGRLQKTYEGFHRWTAGAVLGALGVAALALRPVVPGTSIVLTNGLTYAGVLLALDGTLRFVTGRRLDPRWHVAPWALASVNAFFYWVVDDVLVRQWVFSAPTAAILGAIAWTLVRGAPPEARPLYRAVALLQFAYVVALVGRAVRWTVGPTPTGILEAGGAEAAFFLFLCGADLLNLTGYMMLNGQRLEADLSASQGRLRETLDELTASMAQVKLLTGLLPICSRCKNIRDDQGEWQPVESYVAARTDADFSHGVCPDCLLVLYPEYADLLDRAG